MKKGEGVAPDPSGSRRGVYFVQEIAGNPFARL
jgi:hypothetical protein